MKRPLTAAILAATLATAAPAPATAAIAASAWNAVKSIGRALASNNGATGQVRGSAADTAAMSALRSQQSANLTAIATANTAYRNNPTKANKARLDRLRAQRRSLSAQETTLRNGYSANGQAHDQRQWSD